MFSRFQNADGASSFNAGKIASGLAWPFRGAAFIVSRHGLKRYAVLPLLVNILVHGIAMAAIVWFLYRWQIGHAAWDFWGPVGQFLAKAIGYVGAGFKLALALLAIWAGLFAFTAVGIAVSSPLNSILSEKVEMAAAFPVPDRKMPTTKAVMQSIADTLRLCGLQLLFSLPALPLLAVPLVGFLPLFAVGAYFVGLNFIEVPMSRDYLPYSRKREFAKRNFWEIFAFGAAMQMLFMIPLAGMLVLPAGVAAGTLFYRLRELKNPPERSSGGSQPTT